MALLPEKLRYSFFDRISLQTMRYVDTVPLKKAKGKLREIYQQINRDFFLNGSLTSRSKVENILAATWTLGREAILVDDKVDRTTKEALSAILSNINDCPYCGDMLVSLVHAGDRSEDAMKILDEMEGKIDDPVLKERLEWTKAAVTSADNIPAPPFAEEELPEVIGSVMAMSDINRFSHIVMAGSPVKAPYGSSFLKKAALKIFGNELKKNHSRPLIKGDSLKFLPVCELPEDLAWARPNPRIAEAIARWCAFIEMEADAVIPAEVKQAVHDNLSQWDGRQMPLGRYWVEDETRNFKGKDKVICRFILLMAKASYQIDEDLNEQLLELAGSQENFIRLLAWGSYVSARYLANRIAASVESTDKTDYAHQTEAA